jgi:hypothetical protein
MKEAIDYIRESFEGFGEELEEHWIDRCKLYSVEEILFLTFTTIISVCAFLFLIHKKGALF